MQTEGAKTTDQSSNIGPLAKDPNQYILLLNIGVDASKSIEEIDRQQTGGNQDHQRDPNATHFQILQEKNGI